MFDPGPLAHFLGAYPNDPCELPHGLTHHPLLSLQRLVFLAGTLPRNQIIGRPGDIGIDAYDEFSDLSGQSIASIAQTIEIGNSWLQLSNIDIDREYKALSLEILRPLRATMKGANVPAEKVQTDIILTSPQSVIPFHMERRHRLFFQVRGQSSLHTLGREFLKLIDSIELERAMTGPSPALRWAQDQEPNFTTHTFSEGAGRYIPPMTPLYLSHEDGPGILLTLSWESNVTREQQGCYGMHTLLRKCRLKQQASTKPWAMKFKAKLYEYFGPR